MEEPRRKKSKKSETLKAKIEVVGREEGKSEPIIGYFPSGYDPVKSEAASAAPMVTVLKHKTKSHRMEVVVKPPDSEVDFVGRSHAGEAANPKRCAFALGVLDKATGTLKIVNIAADKIIRLDPRIPRFEKEEEVSSQLVLAEDVPVDARAVRMKRLNMSFGTKKSISMAKKLENLNQIQAAENGEELDDEGKLIKTNKEALAPDGGAANNLGIPHYNIDATTPQQAYPLDKIILEGEWDYLLDIHERVQAGDALDQKAYPHFVCNRVHRLANNQDNAERMKIACMLSYITHLIKFKHQHSANASSAKEHRIPNIIKQKFSAMFSTPGMNTLTKENISLLISYVLVLTLYVDDFRTDITDIAKDLGMHTHVLREHFLLLGAKCVKSVGTLPVPLKFPDRLKKRGRR